MDEMNDETKMTPPWDYEHQQAALREGWIIAECGGSANGPWQIQRIDEPGDCVLEDGTTPPLLDNDDAAWSIVVNGKQPHHTAALAFIEAHNPTEYESLQRFIGSRPPEGI